MWFGFLDFCRSTLRYRDLYTILRIYKKRDREPERLGGGFREVFKGVAAVERARSPVFKGVAAVESPYRLFLRDENP